MDEKRKLAKRNACCCCIRHDKISSSKEVNDTTPTITENIKKNDDEFSTWYSKCTIKYLIEVGLTKLLSRRLNRLVIIVVFLGLFAVSIVSLQWLKTDSDIARFVPDDSYVLAYVDEYENAYGNVFRSRFACIILDEDFSDSTVRDNIKSMINDFDSYSYKESYIINGVDNWLEEFELYINQTYNYTITIDDIAAQGANVFYSELQLFTNTTTYGKWKDEIVYDDDNDPTYIKATKFSMIVAKPKSLRDGWPLRVDLNKVFKRNSIDGFVYEESLPFAYFEWIVVDITIRNILFASSGVLFILFLLMDAKMAIFVILVVLLIDFDLFGWMTMWGVSLDALVFLQLVIAVGLTVDYCIHITHAIAYVSPSDPNDYNQRIGLAMKEMGVGVAKGSWTTFLGCVVLIFSQSEAFRTFFYMFSGVIIVALAHGMLFVPSIVGELPFLYKNIDRPKEKDDNHETATTGKVSQGANSTGFPMHNLKSTSDVKSTTMSAENHTIL